MSEHVINLKSSVKKRSQLKAIFHKFKKNKLAMFGFVILVILIIIVSTAGLYLDYEADVETQDMKAMFLGPSWDHPFGTDQFGRDMFARIIYGGRISLFVGLFTISIALTLGSLIGATAGYYGGKIDNIIMRIMDVFLAIPATIIAIAIVASLGTGLINILIALSISRTPQFARVVRSAILSVKEQDFIEAARACGTKDRRIILRHIIPNAIGPIIVQATLSMATTILVVAGLSFIGLGIQPPTPEWGTMLADGKSQMRYYPYLVVVPGIAIVLAVLSLNLIGDGLRDALDPRLKN